jgi:hypothetical protein
MAGDLVVEFDAAFLPAYSADIAGVVLDTTSALPNAERATAASRGSRSQRSFSQINAPLRCSIHVRRRIRSNRVATTRAELTRIGDAHAILNRSATEAPDSSGLSPRRWRPAIAVAINIGAALLPVIDVGQAPTSARPIQRVGPIRRRAGAPHIPRT